MDGRVELVLSGRVGGRAVGRTRRVRAVAGMFGLEVKEARERVLFEGVRVSVGPGEVVLLTGPSGAGKSTLLRLVERGLRNAECGRRNAERGRLEVVRLEDIPLPRDRAVVDCVGGTLEEGLGALARAGLSEARVLMRPPAELSEGERFRFRLARFFAGKAEVLVADEFGALLDRVTARVVAWQLGRFIQGSRRAAVVATSHEDLARDLGAVRVRLDYG